MSMYRSALSRVPLLRLLLPFVAGVMACGALGQSAVWMSALVGVASMALAAWLRWRCSAMARHRYSIAAIAGLAFALGIADAWVNQPPQLGERFSADEPVVGVVTKIRQNELSTSLLVRTSQVGVVSVLVRGNQYGYAEGDLIAFKPRLERIRNMGNPWEFDYAQYMLRQSVAYTQHVAEASEMVVTGKSKSPYYALQSVRRAARAMIYNSCLSSESKPLLAALLLGYGSDITPEMRQAMSAAGLSHVVALSGLHVGMVAMLVAWLLMPLLRGGRLRTRVACCAAGVMLFALFTGLAPSVCRAAVMMVFASLAVLANRRALSANAVAGAALCIVVLSPAAIYDAGFLLSFVSVTAMIVVLPRFAAAMSEWHPALRYAVACMAVSVVAAAATSALTAYLFHTVSVASVFTNIVVLPLLPAYMALSALYVLLLMAGIDFSVLAAIIGALSHAFVWLCRVVGSCDFLHIENVWISTSEVVLCYGAMASATLLYLQRRLIWTVETCALLTACAGIHIYNVYITPREGVIVLNAYDSTPVFYFADGEARVWCPDYEIDLEEFALRHRSMLSRLGIGHVAMAAPGSDMGGSCFGDNFACIAGWKFVSIGSRSDIRRGGLAAAGPDYVILPKNCRRDVALKAASLPEADVVVSGAMWQDEREALEGELRKAGVRLHSLANEGAIVLDPK